MPSKHVVGVQAAAPGKAVFVQDDPDESVALQSPTVSALGTGSETSQEPSVCRDSDHRGGGRERERIPVQ